MEWLTAEIMFYGGIAIAASAVAMSILCFTVLHIRKIRLTVKLDEEYGKGGEA